MIFETLCKTVHGGWFSPHKGAFESVAASFYYFTTLTWEECQHLTHESIQSCVCTSRDFSKTSRNWILSILWTKSMNTGRIGLD